MPPTPARLHELLLACGFDPAQLERITQQSMGTGLDAITTATDPAEQVRAIVAFAGRYGLIRELTATVLTAGSDRPALQNVLLDDNMSLEDGRTTQETALNLVRLENKVERLSDRVSELANAVTSLTHIMQSGRQATPLNWNIIWIGFIVAALVGSGLFAIAAVK